MPWKTTSVFCAPSPSLFPPQVLGPCVYANASSCIRVRASSEAANNGDFSPQDDMRLHVECEVALDWLAKEVGLGVVGHCCALIWHLPAGRIGAGEGNGRRYHMMPGGRRVGWHVGSLQAVCWCASGLHRCLFS
jgi:hypothetical protein